MVKKFNLKFFISVLAIIFASVYLTFLIDTYTLNTWLKRIYVFCYFVIALFILVKCCARLKLNKCNIVSAIALLLTVFTLALAQNTFLPKKNEHSFYLQSTAQDEESGYAELAIVGVTLDGEKQSISKINVEVIGNWSYEATNDSFIFSPSESNENLICFTVVGENVSFLFKSESTDGHVRIYDDYGYEKIVSLADKNAESLTVEHTIDFVQTYSIAEKIIYNTGALITIAFVYKIALELLWRFVNKYLKKKSDISK